MKYTIQPGDSLSKIALAQGQGAEKWAEIYTLNKSVIGSNPDLIQPGTVLQIPPQWSNPLAVKKAGFKLPTWFYSPSGKVSLVKVSGLSLLLYFLYKKGVK